MALQDLIAQLAAQRQPPPQQPDPAQYPPDPRSLTPLQQYQTKPVDIAALEQPDRQQPATDPQTGLPAEEKPAEDKAKPEEGGEEAPPPLPEDVGKEVEAKPPVAPGVIPAEEETKGLVNRAGGDWWRTATTGYTPYTPPPPDSGPEGWGRPWWPVEADMTVEEMRDSPYMPAVQEAYRLVQDAGRKLYGMASPGVGEPARQAALLLSPFVLALDLISSGRFSQNYFAARRGRMAIQRQQALEKIKESNELHNAQLLAFGDVYLNLKDNLITQDEAERQIRGLLFATHHEVLGVNFDMLGLRGVASHLNQEESLRRQILAGGRSIRKATGDASEDEWAERLGITKVSSAGAGGGIIPEPTEPKAPTPPPAPVTEEKGDFRENAAKRLGISAEEKAIGDALVNGESDDTYADMRKASKVPTVQKGLADIHKYTNALNQERDRILADKTLDTEHKLQAYERNVSPRKAALMRGMLAYDIDPDTDIPAARQERENAVILARQFNPHFNAGGAKLMKQWKNNNTLATRQAQRVSAYIPAVLSVGAALKYIDPNKRIPIAWWDDFVARKFTGAPEYRQLFAALYNVAQETSAIASGTGRPAVSTTHDRIRGMLETMSPAQIMSQIVVDTQAAYGQTRAPNTEFKRLLQDPRANMPFYSKEVEAQYKAIMRMNPFTGEVPSDAPDSVKVIGRKTKPDWMIKETSGKWDWRPLGMKEIVAGRKLLRDPTFTNDPGKQEDLQRLRERLGIIFADPELGDEDYEPPK